MVGNLPLAILENVDERVAALHLGPINSHRELVDSGVLRPVGADDDVSAENLSLGLLEEEGTEIVLDQGIIGSGSVRNGGKEDSFLRVPVGDLGRVLRRKSVVPELEQVTNCLLYTSDAADE